MVDENRLEGLRDEDMRKDIQDSRDRHDVVTSLDTEANWQQLDTGRQSRRADLRKEVEEETASRKYLPNEGDFLPGMTSRETHPITKRNANVGQQLISHVDKLSRISERRPPEEYKTLIGGSLTDGTTQLRLIHTPSNSGVGGVSWKPSNGHVEGLSIDGGHRHMANYLLTQAWNHSRTHGQFGPASSDNLSPFSAKIMKKFNPDSEDFYRHLRVPVPTETCGTCEGTGHEYMRARSLDGGRTVQYHHGYYGDRGRVNIASMPNTRSGRNSLIDQAIRQEPGGGESSDTNYIRHPESNETYEYPTIHHDCQTCNGAGELPMGRE